MDHEYTCCIMNARKWKQMLYGEATQNIYPEGTFTKEGKAATATAAEPPRRRRYLHSPPRPTPRTQPQTGLEVRNRVGVLEKESDVLFRNKLFTARFLFGARAGGLFIDRWRARGCLQTHTLLNIYFISSRFTCWVLYGLLLSTCLPPKLPGNDPDHLKNWEKTGVWRRSLHHIVAPHSPLILYVLNIVASICIFIFFFAR